MAKKCKAFLDDAIATRSIIRNLEGQLDEAQTAEDFDTCKQLRDELKQHKSAFDKNFKGERNPLVGECWKSLVRTMPLPPTPPKASEIQRRDCETNFHGGDSLCGILVSFSNCKTKQLEYAVLAHSRVALHGATFRGSIQSWEPWFTEHLKMATYFKNKLLDTGEMAEDSKFDWVAGFSIDSENLVKCSSCANVQPGVDPLAPESRQLNEEWRNGVCELLEEVYKELRGLLLKRPPADVQRWRWKWPAGRS